jgi:hypothetical protein
MTQRTSKIFQATWPKASHWRQATCEEVACPHFLLGWVTRVIRGSDNDLYIKADKKRRYKMGKEGELNAYYFEAGQQCFRSEAGSHYVRLERGPWLTINALDRQPARLQRNAMESERWKNDFNEESYRSNGR